MSGSHSSQPGSSSPLIWSAWLIAHIWIKPEGIIPVVAAEIEIAECQCLLKHRVVDVAHHRHDDAHLVAHIVASNLIGAVGEAVRMPLVGRAQQEQRGGKRSAGNHHRVGRIDFLRSVPLHMNGVDPPTARICPELRNIGVGQQRDIVVFREHRVDANHLRVRLAIQETREAIERGAAYAGAGRRRETVLLLVEQNAEREMEGLETDGSSACRTARRLWAHVSPRDGDKALAVGGSVGSSPRAPCTWNSASAAS